MRNLQRGLTTVEFAFAGALAFIVLFGCIEFGRVLFVWNTIAEATRRGARVAIVNDITDPSVAKAAVLAYGSWDGLTQASVSVKYYEEDGKTETADTDDVRYVRVKVFGLKHKLLIPFVGRELDVPECATTLPTESIGI